jgi:hypothetical protein
MASFHGLFAFTLIGRYPLTCRCPLYRVILRSHLDSRLTRRWPLCMASLRSHLQVDFRLQSMASLRGLFGFTLTRRKSLTCRWSFWFHTYSQLACLCSLLQLDGLFTFTLSTFRWPVSIHTEVNGLFVFTQVGTTIGNKKKATYQKITFSGNFATPNLPKRFHSNFLIEI